MFKRNIYRRAFFLINRGGCSLDSLKKTGDLPRSVQDTHNLNALDCHPVKNNVVGKIRDNKGANIDKFLFGRPTKSAKFRLGGQATANLPGSFQNTVRRLRIIF
jgi:hypothetical protein